VLVLLLLSSSCSHVLRRAVPRPRRARLGAAIPGQSPANRSTGGPARHPTSHLCSHAQGARPGASCDGQGDRGGGSVRAGGPRSFASLRLTVLYCTALYHPGFGSQILTAAAAQAAALAGRHGLKLLELLILKDLHEKVLVGNGAARGLQRMEGVLKEGVHGGTKELLDTILGAELAAKLC
jgi:hypothetical protein